ncbi:MAG: cytochrome c oxidase subunit II [Paracoccaceae bacterium]
MHFFSNVFYKLFLSILLFIIPLFALGLDNFNDLEVIGKPEYGGINFQPAVTELARDILWLDNFLLIIITSISLFVIILLAIVFFRFNKKSNPEPANFTHHSTLEITWTLVPTAILVVIGAFSLPMLFKQLNIPEYDITIKATGNQWYWSYEYPDSEISFDSFMLTKEELSKHGYSDDEYLLATDNPVIVPVGSVVRMQVTGADVLHAWKIPAFGVHLDAVPGRLNEGWYKVDKEGTYFGQCSELCGLNHSYMPIVVKAVTKEKYKRWIEQATIEFSSVPNIKNINLAKK